MAFLRTVVVFIFFFQARSHSCRTPIKFAALISSTAVVSACSSNMENAEPIFVKLGTREFYVELVEPLHFCLGRTI